VVDRSDDASCLLGLAGLAVERVVPAELGVKIVQLVTDDPDAARCPGCRAVSSSGKDWVLTRPRDLPCGGEFAVMQWRKRRWRCRTENCPQQTFTEQVGRRCCVETYTDENAGQLGFASTIDGVP
jgi:transposase